MGTFIEDRACHPSFEYSPRLRVGRRSPSLILHMESHSEVSGSRDFRLSRCVEIERAATHTQHLLPMPGHVSSTLYINKPEPVPTNRSSNCT